MAKLVHIPDVNVALAYWKEGMLVNIKGVPWCPFKDLIVDYESMDEVLYRLPGWVKEKPEGGGAYIWVEEDSDG